jgi:energy-coupling factor transporter ATP-binding protein EcfA2
MAIEFRGVDLAPLHNLNATAPGGAVIGVIGQRGGGAGELLLVAAGKEKPEAGEVLAGGTRQYAGPYETPDWSSADIWVVQHSLAHLDALEREQARVAIERLRAAGSTVLIGSNEEELLRTICDEVWWMVEGRLERRGDPGEVLDAYRKSVVAQFVAWGERQSVPLEPAMRKGDGRGEIVSIETAGASGRASMVLQSGEAVSVRVTVRYRARVEDPVLGIMIRTRVGLAVYGTNTELEKVKIGPCEPGEAITASFQFRCDLCPGDYTLTAASHDSDGTAHDWMDDAVGFVVADSRYTAGVANLRAKVTVEKKVEATSLPK